VDPIQRPPNESPRVDKHISADLVDPRDISWEADEPEFRVLFYRPSIEQATAEKSMFSTAMYRLTGCSVSEAVTWAQNNQRREHSDGYVLYVIARFNGRVGAVRLEGIDPWRPQAAADNANQSADDL
jgi:hypothetical protein